MTHSSTMSSDRPLVMYGGLRTLFVPFGVLVLGIAYFAVQGAAQLPEL